MCGAFVPLADSLPTSLGTRNPLPSSCKRPRAQCRRPLTMTARADTTGIPTPVKASKKISPPKNFSWTRAWYPVLWEKDFDTSRPYPFRIFDTPLVMFQDKMTKRYVALLDVCPHRAAPLSEGRLVDKKGEETLLECGYHGWTFDKSGDCVRIPQCPPEQTIPQAASCRRKFATTTKLGIVFVWFGDYDDAEEKVLPIPSFFEKHKNATIFRDQTRILPYSYQSFIENVSDPAHVPWVHTGVQGDRNKVQPNTFLEIIETDKNTGAFSAAYTVSPTTGLKSVFTFQPPCVLSYEINFQRGAFALTTMAVPIRGMEEAVRVLTFNAIDTKGLQRWLVKLIPRWYEHTKANLVLDGDLPLLRSQERWLGTSPPGQERVLSGDWRSNFFMGANSMDKGVILFRNWFDSTRPLAPWISEPAPIRTPYDVGSRQVNLNRYEQHTRDCRSCRKALRRFRMLRALLLALATTAAIVTVILLVVAFYVPLVGASHGTIALLMTTVTLAGAVLAHRFIQKLTYSEEAYKISHAD